MAERALAPKRKDTHVDIVGLAFLLTSAGAGAAVGFCAYRWIWSIAPVSPRMPSVRNARMSSARPQWIAALLTAILAAALVGATVWTFGATWAALAFSFLTVVGVQLSIIDLRLKVLPNAIVLPSIVVGVALLTLTAVFENAGPELLRGLLAAAALFALYFVLALISPNGLGMGDVKLAALVGLYLGFLGWTEVFVGTFAAFVLAALVGLVVMASGRGNRTTAIPFGPMMLAGVAVAVLVADLLAGFVLPSR
jgi:leader peptidase (prepilin peptidase)/N-methyltransferase